MSRMYIVNHWNDAAAYSGEQIGDRLKDSSALHFNRDGSANVNLYSEETALAKKKTSVPLADRILPQAKRVRVLTEQLYELEAERKAGMDIHTYSKLRDILIVKRDRAQELLKKAANVRPNRTETQEVSVKTAYSNRDVQHIRTEVATPCGVSWIDDLSPSNSFKKILQVACKTTKTLVRYSQAAKQYVKTLSDV